MNPMYYDFSHCSARARTYAWCHDLRARGQRAMCPACGRVTRDVWRGPFEAGIDASGSRWPDLMGVGSSGPWMLFAERVAEALKPGLAGAKFEPVAIGEILGKKLQAIAPPRYFVLTFEEPFMLDLAASGLGTPACVRCQLRDRLPAEARPKDAVIAGGKQPGLVFALANYHPRAYFCTESCIDLAREHAWTNASFKPMNLPAEDAAGWAGIDYKKADWREHQYPIDPNADKSPGELLVEFLSQDTDSRLTATRSLLKRGAQVFPLLMDRLAKAPDAEHRYRLATLVREISVKQSLPLDDSSRRRVEEALVEGQ